MAFSVWIHAKKAAAFFSTSRSMRSSRTSLRRRASSSRSTPVSPVRPLVRSACARRTHSANADGVRSSSRATAPTVLPSSRTSRIAPALNSSLHCRRTRLPAVRNPILDIVSAFRNVSTKPDQAQYGLNASCATRYEQQSRLRAFRHGIGLRSPGADPRNPHRFDGSRRGSIAHRPLALSV